MVATHTGGDLEDQTPVRDYRVRLLSQELGAPSVAPLGSQTELRGVQLLLFDLDLGGGSTVERAIGWAERVSACRLVALSSAMRPFPFKQLQFAVVSMVHKNDAQSELVQALLSAGHRDPLSPMKLPGLKEHKVLAQLGQRLRIEENAALPGCSAFTVADHRNHIMAEAAVPPHRGPDRLCDPVRRGASGNAGVAGGIGHPGAW